MKIKQVIVGTFSTGFEDCQLVLREGEGAEFYNCPGVGECPRIKIGADVESWKDIVAAVLHEVMEFCFNRLKCRYDCSYDLGRDHAGYLFVSSHPMFSDACARASHFLAECLPGLKSSWERWRKNKAEGKEG